MKRHKRLDKWDALVPGKDAFNPKKRKVEGHRYLDFGIVQQDGKGYLVYHVPTCRLVHTHGYKSEKAARGFVLALYQLGSWESPMLGDYKDRAGRVVEIAARYGA